MNTSRPFMDIINAPQKGDKVEYIAPPTDKHHGVNITLTVKDVYEHKGNKVMDIKFQGENDVKKQWKRVRPDVWADQLLYLSRYEIRGGHDDAL